MAIYTIVTIGFLQPMPMDIFGSRWEKYIETYKRMEIRSHR